MKTGWIIFLIVGLLIIFLAYLIKFKKQAQLIAGYNENEIADKDGFCNWIGSVFICLGLFTIIISILIWWQPVNDSIIVFAFVAGALSSCIIAIKGAKKYKK